MLSSRLHSKALSLTAIERFRKQLSQVPRQQTPSHTFLALDSGEAFQKDPIRSLPNLLSARCKPWGLGLSTQDSTIQADVDVLLKRISPPYRII